MSTHFDYLGRPVQVVVTDRVGGEIARAATARHKAGEFAKGIRDSRVLCLPADIFGGNVDRYIPMDRIGEIQVER
ncbi:hypothetical protein [Micromonospora peucetia]|uniref:Uncharacterized protein n=1 Tax=Micromonospora peucetia TaxID=47871 RepID=A0ABZ1EJY4_9ACTN|nr:hypothetical protein [Micromonospora peucetia]WSA34574.1 hypothetical protein OIE14_11270 [Micromonospora peucetia]